MQSHTESCSCGRPSLCLPEACRAVTHSHKEEGSGGSRRWRDAAVWALNLLVFGWWWSSSERLAQWGGVAEPGQPLATASQPRNENSWGGGTGSHEVWEDRVAIAKAPAGIFEAVVEQPVCQLRQCCWGSSVWPWPRPICRGQWLQHWDPDQLQEQWWAPLIWALSVWTTGRTTQGCRCSSDGQQPLNLVRECVCLLGLP